MGTDGERKRVVKDLVNWSGSFHHAVGDGAVI